MSGTHGNGFVVLVAVLAFACGVVACVATLWAFDAGAAVGPSVRRDRLVALRPGMSETEVVALVGWPLCRRPVVLGREDRMAWLYTRPGLFGSGLEVTLVIEQERLDGIYVEDSDLLVYRCDRQGCLDAQRELRFRLP